MITLRRAATFVIVLSALALSGIPPAGADPGTINLSWDDCSTFGTSAKTFACNVNTGPAFNLIGSFTPPEAMPLFVGLSAALTVQSSTATLPDWWRFGSSECRGSALSVAFDYTSGPFSCLDPYSGNALGGLLYTIGFGGVDRASLRLQGAIPLGFDFLIEPENEYYGFTIRIRRSNTAGAGSCSGCEVPMTIHLDEIGLFQSSEINHRLTMPGHGTTVTWSGEPVPPEAPDIVSFSPAGGTAGTEVTVQGQRFTGTTSVTFGSQSASFEVESDQIIKTTAPPNVHTSHIIVTTPGGSDQSDEAFVVPDTPTSEGINLSWDDCGLNGSTDMAVVCDSNEGSPFSMVVSFAPPPGLDSLWAAEGEIDVFSASETLPDWWRMGIGQCRGFEALRAETGFSSGPYSCFAFWDESAFAGATIGQDPDHPNRGRLSFSCATSIGFEGPVDPSHEYYVMRINIMRMKTTGPDACGGCEVPACIVLNSITMSQALGSTYNPILTMPKDRNVIRWGSPPDCPITTPVLASLVTAEAGPGRVRLEWLTEEITSARLERRRGTGAWAWIAELRAGGDHKLRYEDTDVAPGATYGYRLATAAANREIYLGETSVTVPAVTGLALARATGTADARVVAVSLTLSRATPARLELFDVGGRLRASRSLTGLGAGDHQVDLAARIPLGPGVYYMRLIQDGTRATRTFTLSR